MEATRAGWSKVDVRPGTVIDKFEVVELLGQGAMASVYLVRHRHLDAPYALKVLQIQRPEVAERLLTEGRVQAGLRHPNVVGVSDVILVNGQPGLVLEFVDGPTLERFIKDYGPLDIPAIDHIGLSIAKGLRAAHRAGHLHRDLKPANILMDYLDDQWIPKIADFGLAKFLFGGGDGEVSVTRTGQIMGSPTFMSPEQCRDAKSVDQRADVFALGAVLYELATGQRCFDAPDVVQVFARIVSGAFVPVIDLRPDLPRRMVMAIHGALVVDPAHRIPDVDTFMAVWEGRQHFEANQQDVTQSVVALLGDDPALYSGTHATLAPRKPKKRVRPSRVVGSMAAVSAFGLLTVGALLTGFIVMYAIASWYRAPPPLTLTDPDAVGPQRPPEIHAPEEPVVEPEPVVDPEPVRPEPVRPSAPEPVRTMPPAPEPVRSVPDPLPPPVPVPVVPLPAPVFGPILASGELGEVRAAKECLVGLPPTAPDSFPAVISVEVDGSVSTVQLRDVRYAGGPVEACLRRALDGFRFSARPESPQRLTFPFTP
ncbi:MAG: serine/threonine protein kinase [Alphaproteobacteria bacterium]|nr:serine/threonine protein kinase [Alphaproteobacteria bacterium]